MQITIRTKISLSQLYDLYELPFINILFEKNSMDSNCRNIADLKDSITSSGNIQLLVEETVSTKQDLRSRITPRYKFDERWNDFEKCLFLDGYKINGNSLVLIEPNIEGVLAFEDDLTNEIANSSLFRKDEIIQLINDSATSFKTNDFNGCLSKARISIETMIRGISEDKFTFTNNWGSSLSKLRIEAFITQDEENAIASTYTLISNGSHIPLGFTEEEYTRYSRNLIMSVCYYIIKRYKQKF